MTLADIEGVSTPAEQLVGTPSKNRAKHTAPERLLELVPVSTIQMQRTNWLDEDHIPLGEETLLVGPEGYGKSAIATDYTARTSRGTVPGDLYGVPSAAVYCTTEDSWARTVKPRLVVAGADLDAVFCVSVNGEDGTLRVPDDIEQLTEAMFASGARLLVLDPLTSHVSGRVNTHRDSEWRNAIAPLRAAVDLLDAAVIGLIHFNKGDSVVALDRIMGSRAISATSRAVLGVTDDREDDTEKVKVLVQLKNTLGPLDLPARRYRFDVCYLEDPVAGRIRTIRIKWLGETTGTTRHDIFKTRGERGTYVTAESTAKVLTELLGDYERHPAADILAALKKDPRASTNDKTLSSARWIAGAVFKREGGVPTYHIPRPPTPPASEQEPPEQEPLLSLATFDEHEGDTITEHRFVNVLSSPCSSW
jgi:hypothetical protein